MSASSFKNLLKICVINPLLLSFVETDWQLFANLDLKLYKRGGGQLVIELLAQNL